MYLNAKTTSKSRNKVVDVINGVPVIQHSHYNDRYTSRVRPIFEVSQNRKLMYKNIRDYALASIRRNIDKIVTKDGSFTQNFIVYQMPLSIAGKKVVIEMALLITSSLAKFDYHHEKVVNPEYKEHFDKGILKFREPVICIETILSTIRTEDENRIAYSDYSDEHIIETVVVKPRTFITGEIFKDMTTLIRRQHSMCTNTVTELVKAI